MARARDPNRDEAFKLWEKHNGEIDLVQIAEQLSVSPGTVRGWKSKDKWDAKLNGTFQSKERNAPKAKERSKGNETKDKSVEIKPSDLSNDLTDKQRLFCIYYLKYFNATKAYQKVYGCEYATAMSNGSKLLRNTKVSDEIGRLREERSNELNLQLNDVIQQYIDIAFADIKDFMEFGQKEEYVYDDKGKQVFDPETSEPMTYKRNYVLFKNDSEVDGTIIGEVKQGRDGASIKLHDKMRALERLERYLGHMTEEQKLKVAKAKLELQAMTKEGEVDPHEQGSSYEGALNAQVEDIFADEVNEDG